MIKKQKLKGLSKIAHIFLLSVMIFGSVFVYFQNPNVAKAENCDLIVQDGRPLSVTYDGQTLQGVSAQLETNKDGVKWGEKFNAYANLKLPSSVSSSCKSSSIKYYFGLYFYTHGAVAVPSGHSPYKQAVWDDSIGGFHASWENLAFKDLGLTDPATNGGGDPFETVNQMDVYAFFYKTTASQSYLGRDYLDEKILNFLKPDNGSYGQPVRDVPQVNSPPIQGTGGGTFFGETFQASDVGADISVLAPDNYFRTWLEGGKIQKLYKAKDSKTAYDGPTITAKLAVSKPRDFIVFENGDIIDDRGLDLQVEAVYAQLFTDKMSCDQASKTWATWVTTCSDPGHNVVDDTGTITKPDPDFPSGPNSNGNSKKYWKSGVPTNFTANIVGASEEYKLNTVGKHTLYLGVGFAKGGVILPASDIWFVKGQDSKPSAVVIEVYENKTEFDKHINEERPSDVPTNEGFSSTAGDVKPCQSNGIICFMRDVVVFVVSLIRELIYTVFFLVVLPMLQAILSIHTYTDTFSSIIYPGWVIIRNICNVLLVLAMIIIGLATLFRVDGYNYKQLLVRVILAALFVNFSLVLGQAVLGIADTAQNQFLPNATAPLNQLGGALMVGNVNCSGESMCSFPSLNSANPSGLADITYTIFQLALTIGSFIAFCAIAALLIVRLVALWILLMVSPIAWVANVLPATEKYRGEWWSHFLKYAFFSPIMGFFLNLTAVISLTLHSKLKDVSAGQFATAATANNGMLGGADFSSFIFQVTANVLLIAFLVAAVMVAQTFGIKGADAAVNAVSKGMKSPFGALGWAGKEGGKALGTYGAEKFLEQTGVEIRPAKWLEGWKESRDINKRRREERGLLKAEGRSYLATTASPTSFFQRYWGLKEAKGVLTGSNMRGKRLLKRAEELEHAAEHEADPDRKLALQKQSADLERRGKALVHAPDYITQQKTRHAVNKEKAEIHAETWEELVDLAEGAVRENNVSRYLAILQKLAETYNENEIITHTRYTKDMSAAESADGLAHQAGEYFTDGWAGIENYRKQILQDGFKLSEQSSMRFMADMTDIAESKNHHGIMRAYGTKFGRYRHKPKEEWNGEVSAEKGKMQTGQLIMQSNRLSGYEEYTGKDYDVDNTRIQILQDNQLDYYMKNWNAIKFLYRRGQINPSQAKAAAMPHNAARIMSAANRLEEKMVEVKDDNGNTVYEREADGRVRMVNGQAVPQMVNQREEAKRVLGEMFIEFGKQQISRDEAVSHEKIVQQLLADDKIEHDARQQILDSMNDPGVADEFKFETPFNP